MTDIPSAARKVEAKAREAGWTVRGSLRVAEKVDYLLRFARGDERLEARWTDGKFSGAWQAIPHDVLVAAGGGVSPRRIGARELAALLTTPGGEVAA